MRLLYVKSQPDSFSLDPGQTHSFHSRAAVDFPCLRRWRESIVAEIVDKVQYFLSLTCPRHDIPIHLDGYPWPNLETLIHVPELLYPQRSAPDQNYLISS